MEIVKIYSVVLLIVAAVIIVVNILKANRHIFDDTCVGFWWVISVGIAQFYAITLPAIIYIPWIIEHLWIVHISAGVSLVSTIIWAFENGEHRV